MTSVFHNLLSVIRHFCPCASCVIHTRRLSCITNVNVDCYSSPSIRLHNRCNIVLCSCLLADAKCRIRQKLHLIRKISCSLRMTDGTSLICHLWHNFCWKRGGGDGWSFVHDKCRRTPFEIKWIVLERKFQTYALHTKKSKFLLNFHSVYMR
jgi:hypothetical protein